MRKIFSDFEILVLDNDSESDGIFMKARKPAGFIENDISEHDLYNILLERRVRDVTSEYVFKAISRSVIRKYMSFIINKHSWIHTIWRMIRNGH
jgi:hypothetical protein